MSISLVSSLLSEIARTLFQKLFVRKIKCQTYLSSQSLKKSKSYRSFVELNRIGVDAQNHLYFAISFEIIFEQKCQFRVPSLDAISESHQRRINAARLPQPRAGVLGALGAFTAGQVHQRQLAHIDRTLLAAALRLHQANAENTVTPRRLRVQLGVRDHSFLLRLRNQVQGLFDCLHLELIHVLDVHAALGVFLQIFRLFQVLSARHGRSAGRSYIVKQVINVVVVDFNARYVHGIVVVAKSLLLSGQFGGVGGGRVGQTALAVRLNLERVHSVRLEDVLAGNVALDGLKQTVERALQHARLVLIADHGQILDERHAHLFEQLFLRGLLVVDLGERVDQLFDLAGSVRGRALKERFIEVYVKSGIDGRLGAAHTSGIWSIRLDLSKILRHDSSVSLGRGRIRHLGIFILSSHFYEVKGHFFISDGISDYIKMCPENIRFKA
ncbi:hypothetical protein BpHYR1_011643 [Brachionus plicatilis]|uniref:Uncharacterized protein n=1 Tax=Brachionus plicatilis TaxID=10195 RepID=A0A3M7R5Q3_BRAPC|nr:hypothetical protein BpHYR1_011643 [Brachionus plicatilis]